MKMHRHKAVRSVVALGAATAITLAPMAQAQDTSRGFEVSQEVLSLDRDIRASYNGIEVTQGQTEKESAGADTTGKDVTFYTNDNTAWFSVNYRTGEITVNPGTDVPPQDYNFLITVRYGSSLTGTGEELVQNVHAKVTVHAKDYAPSSSSETSTSAQPSAPSTTPVPKPGVNLPSITDLINQANGSLQPLIDEITRQTADAQSQAEAAIKALNDLVNRAQQEHTAQVQAQLEELQRAASEAAARAQAAAHDAAANAVNDASSVTQAQIDEFNRQLATRLQSFFDAIGAEYNPADDTLTITINGIVNVSGLVDDPAAFYEQLNNLLAGLNNQIDAGTLPTDKAVEEATQQIKDLLEQARQEVSENTGESGDSAAAPAKSESTSTATSASVKEASNKGSAGKKKLADTGSETFGMALSAMVLAGVGFFLMRRGRRA